MILYTHAEIVIGGVANRGNIIPVPSISALDYYGKKAPTDAYNSVYMHEASFATFKALDGSRTGYKGAVQCERLHFDFDGETSLADVRYFIDFAGTKYKICIDDFIPYFSGNKGFHLYIKLKPQDIISGENAHIQTYKVCERMASNLASFDPSVYDRTRIFRTPNSIHSKTGLHKIPLTMLELYQLNIDQIKQLAKKQRSLKVIFDEHFKNFEKEWKKSL